MEKEKKVDSRRIVPHRAKLHFCGRHRSGNRLSQGLDSSKRPSSRVVRSSVSLPTSPGFRGYLLCRTDWLQLRAGRDPIHPSNRRLSLVQCARTLQFRRAPPSLLTADSPSYGPTDSIYDSEPDLSTSTLISTPTKMPPNGNGEEMREWTAIPKEVRWDEASKPGTPKRRVCGQYLLRGSVKMASLSTRSTLPRQRIQPVVGSRPR